MATILWQALPEFLGGLGLVCLMWLVKIARSMYGEIVAFRAEVQLMNKRNLRRFARLRESVGECEDRLDSHDAELREHRERLEKVEQEDPTRRD